MLPFFPVFDRLLAFIAFSHRIPPIETFKRYFVKKHITNNCALTSALHDMIEITVSFQFHFQYGHGMNYKLVPIRKWLISASGLDFNPQNTQCIPAVKIFVFLDLEQN